LNALASLTSPNEVVPARDLATDMRWSVPGGILYVRLGAESEGSKIQSIRWEGAASHAGASEPSPELAWLHKAFQRYFSDGTPMGGVPWAFLDPSGWTEFQNQVYRAIAEIPHGQTRTYGWVASRIGNPSASRAVGQALRCNPLPILVPCHRVTAVASVGGFMGTIDPGGSEIQLKQRLIALEEGFLNPIFEFLRD
jgi:methylated-DNA-[protein]-cysteine S-methyltransferase